MKNETDIHRAHDMLAELVAGKHPEITVSEDVMLGARVSLDVLCWVLDHDPLDTAFAKNLDNINAIMEKAGFKLIGIH